MNRRAIAGAIAEAVMRITEYEIYAFILGAGAGSIVTYYNIYNITRDRRAIRAVREQIDRYGYELGAREVITKGQCGRTIDRNQEQFISDKQILENYRWAQAVKRSRKEWKRRSDPATLAAITIICGEFLGLSERDAFQALVGAETLHQVVDSLIERKAALVSSDRRVGS